ncbi:MAG: hypothetical protein AAF572_02210 [Cyanobacteria bacterium P01_B01_bin.77]
MVRYYRYVKIWHVWLIVVSPWRGNMLLWVGKLFLQGDTTASWSEFLASAGLESLV